MCIRDRNYIDSALSLHDGLLYFRINKWGAFLLGQADDYVPALPTQRELFSIDEALQVHVLTDLLPNEQLQLDVVAEPVEANVYRSVSYTHLGSRLRRATQESPE